MEIQLLVELTLGLKVMQFLVLLVIRSIDSVNKAFSAVAIDLNTNITKLTVILDFKYE